MKQYETYEKQNITKELLNSFKVGDLVKVNTWRKPMRIVATSENFFIMICRHFDTYMYSICEKNKRGHSYNLLYKPNRGYSEDEFVCGKDNYVFGKFDYDNEEDCKEALKELESGEMEVSTRSGLGISLLRVKRA